MTSSRMHGGEPSEKDRVNATPVTPSENVCNHSTWNAVLRCMLYWFRSEIKNGLVPRDVVGHAHTRERDHDKKNVSMWWSNDFLIFTFRFVDKNIARHRPHTLTWIHYSSTGHCSNEMNFSFPDRVHLSYHLDSISVHADIPCSTFVFKMCILLIREFYIVLGHVFYSTYGLHSIAIWWLHFIVLLIIFKFYLAYACTGQELTK